MMTIKHGQNTPQLAQHALFGREAIKVHQKEKKPETAPRPQPKLSIVLGVCCRCKERPAVLKSPSDNPESIYCEACGVSRCKIHTIVDFVEDDTGRWVDPCCIRHNVQQQSLVEAE